jgi:hypothetical protein
MYVAHFTIARRPFSLFFSTLLVPQIERSGGAPRPMAHAAQGAAQSTDRARAFLRAKNVGGCGAAAGEREGSVCRDRPGTRPR